MLILFFEHRVKETVELYDPLKLIFIFKFHKIGLDYLFYNMSCGERNIVRMK